MSPQTWGTKVHYAVKQSVEALRPKSGQLNDNCNRGEAVDEGHPS